MKQVVREVEDLDGNKIKVRSTCSWSRNAIVTKYVGPTDTTGSTVTAKDDNDNRITVDFRHNLNSDQNHERAAVLLCDKMGWPISDIWNGSMDNGYIFLVAIDWGLYSERQNEA